MQSQISSALSRLESGDSGHLTLGFHCKGDMACLTRAISGDLGKALQTTTRLVQALEIYPSHREQFKISTAALRKLLAAMALNKEQCCFGLQTLTLDGLCIGNKGVAELKTNFFRHASRLTALDLGRNGIDDAGLSMLCGALSSLPRLNHLNLSGNNIGNAGLHSLEEAIPLQKGLGKVFLAGNIFDRTAALRFLQNAALSGKLRILDFGFILRDLAGFPVFPDASMTNLAKFFSFVLAHPLHIASGAGDCDQVKNLLQSETHDINSTDEVQKETNKFLPALFLFSLASDFQHS